MPLNSNFFYHSLIRKYVIAFGDLFNQLSVVRYRSDGTEAHRVRVPISYGPKEKWLVRLLQDPDPNKPIAIQLPRIGFEIVDFKYASYRKIPNNHRMTTRTEDPADTPAVFTPVPYDITFNLYTLTKSEDEASQIIEQILPMFTPDLTLTLQTLEDFQYPDITINLLGTKLNDTYDGKFEQRRLITWALTFTMQTYFYGPIRRPGIIETVYANIYTEIDATDPAVIITHQKNPYDYDFTTTIEEPGIAGDRDITVPFEGVTTGAGAEANYTQFDDFIDQADEFLNLDLDDLDIFTP